MKTATIGLDVINCNRSQYLKTKVSLITNGATYKIITTTGDVTDIKDAPDSMVKMYKEELNYLLSIACPQCETYPCKCNSKE